MVSSEEYLKLIEESLSKTGLDVEMVFLEPESKILFSALVLPVLASIKKKNERYMVMPSDHYIPFNKSFYETCSNIQNQFKNSINTFRQKAEHTFNRIWLYLGRLPLIVT